MTVDDLELQFKFLGISPYFAELGDNSG